MAALDIASGTMINGVHALIYAKDADQARAFFRDVLRFPAADVGHGWLIFAMPPAELGIHPAGSEECHELYFMCDDVRKTMADLKAKGVECSPVTSAGWGLVTSFEIPGGGRMGLYQPRHETAMGKWKAPRARPEKQVRRKKPDRSPKPTRKPARDSAREPTQSARSTRTAARKRPPRRPR